MSELILNINNVRYRGFEDVQIVQSMNQMCSAFAVGANNFFQGGTSVNDIKMGDSIQIEIDGQLILTGYIDRMPIKYGQNFDRMDMYGRSKTCDLIDCSFDTTPNEWKNQTVENIIKNLCNPFDITVSTDTIVNTQANKKVETFKATEGAFISEDIIRLCRDYNIVPICDELGNLRLTKSDTENLASNAIIVGINAQAGYLDQSNINRYSSYKVKGQGYGTDEKSLTDFIEPVGEFSDSVIDRERPLVIFSENNTNIDMCRNRAKWEARIRAGLSRKIQYEIQGWTQTDGSVWELNSIVTVDDYITGIQDAMLINDIIFEYDEETSGEITKITVVDKNTYIISDDSIQIKTGYDN